MGIRTRLHNLSLGVMWFFCWALVFSYSAPCYPVENAEGRNSAEKAETARADADGETGLEETEEPKKEIESGKPPEVAGRDEAKAREKAEKEKKILRREETPKNKRIEEKKDANIFDEIGVKREKRGKDRFELDFEPSEEKKSSVMKEKKTPTPFYKHWLFWTILGVAACGGTLIYLKYGNEKGADTMSISASRRNL